MVSVGRNLKNHLVHSPVQPDWILPMMSHAQFLQAYCSNVTSLHHEKFLMSNLHLLSFHLKPMSLLLTVQTLVKSLPLPFSQVYFICRKVAIRCQQNLLFSSRNTPSCLIEVFQTSDNLHSPPVKLFQWAHVFLELEAPGLDEVFQVESPSDTLPSTYWSHFFWCNSGYCWLSGLQMNIATSYPILIHQ